MSFADRLKGVPGKGSLVFSFVSCVIILGLTGIIVTCVCCGQASAGSPSSPDIIIYTDSGQSTISVINIPQESIVGHLSGFSTPYRFAISPDSHRLYVADAGSNSIIVVDTTTNRPIATVSLGGSPSCIALSADGAKAYVGTGQDTVAIIDAVALSVKSTVKVGNLPRGICVNPLSGDVYVVNTYDKSVSVIRGNSVAATITLDGYPEAGLAVTPDGSRLYVADGYSQIYVIDTSNNTLLTTFSTGQESYPISIAFSSDGANVYVACSAKRCVRVFSTRDYSQVHEFSVPSPSKIIMDLVNPGDRYFYVLSATDGVMAVDIMRNQIIRTVKPAGLDFAVARFTWDVVLPDPAPPTTTLDLAGPVDARGSYINEVRCTLTATDNSGGTGVKLTEYNLPGTGWVRYTGPFNVSTKGLITLLYRSSDNADNLEPTRTAYINIVSPQNAATPTPSPTPWPTLNLATASPVPSAAPDNVTSPTPTALPGYASATPSATPAATATPTPTPVPSAGFETVVAFLGVLCAGYALAVRKR